MTPEPWEPGYKPPTAAEAFDSSQPLPRAALAALDYINRKDARIVELEALLRKIRASLREEIAIGGKVPFHPSEIDEVLES